MAARFAKADQAQYELKESALHFSFVACIARNQGKLLYTFLFLSFRVLQNFSPRAREKSAQKPSESKESVLGDGYRVLVSTLSRQILQSD